MTLEYDNLMVQRAAVVAALALARKREILDGLQHCLEPIPEPTKTTLRLYLLEDRTYEEVAEKLSISISAVWLRVKQALPSYRNCLEAHGLHELRSA